MLPCEGTDRVSVLRRQGNFWAQQRPTAAAIAAGVSHAVLAYVSVLPCYSDRCFHVRAHVLMSPALRLDGSSRRGLL